MDFYLIAGLLPKCLWIYEALQAKLSCLRRYRCCAPAAPDCCKRCGGSRMQGWIQLYLVVPAGQVVPFTANQSYMY